MEKRRALCFNYKFRFSYKSRKSVDALPITWYTIHKGRNSNVATVRKALGSMRYAL